MHSAADPLHVFQGTADAVVATGATTTYCCCRFFNVRKVLLELDLVVVFDLSGKFQRPTAALSGSTRFVRFNATVGQKRKINLFFQTVIGGLAPFTERLRLQKDSRFADEEWWYFIPLQKIY